MRQIGLFITTVLLSALFGQASLANGTVHYLFDESQVPVGSTFIYTKSNLDGSNAGTIAVHYLSPTIIESFKYHEGHDQATKVRATIGPRNLNVHQFEASRLGEVSLTSPELDDHAGRPATKYRIDGPGLDHRGGLIWFDAEEGYLLGYEIEKPDEDSYRSGKLRLEEIVEMDAGAWQAYQRSSLDWHGTMPVQ